MDPQDAKTQSLGIIRGLPSCLCVFVVSLLLAATGAVHAQDEAPVLISTTGGESIGPSRPLVAVQKAAAAGDAEACYQLGYRYERGDGVKRDFTQARTLYDQAAAGGVAAAIFRLGRFYQNGIGGDADPVRAFQCYRTAALAGNPLAQYNLGAMLVSARGVVRDYVEGLAWLILATRNQVEGDGEQRVRAHLAGQPETIAAAEKRADALAREIAARHGAKPVWPLPASDSLVPDATLQAPALDKPRLEPPKIEPQTIEPPKFEPPPLAPPTPGS